MKKSLTLTIRMTDPDHTPAAEEKTFSVSTGAPWLTWGRIIEAIRKIADEQELHIVEQVDTNGAEDSGTTGAQS